ncbi:MAG: SOS response-associated peptidase [Fidelibacterota bacterium]
MKICLNSKPMCGRKTLTRDMQSIIEELAVEEWQEPENYLPSYNIAPTQKSPVLIFDQVRKVIPMQWGLVPAWAKEATIGTKLINARAETLLEKPSFKRLVPTRRCVVPADGYYEWQKTGSSSIPYYIYPADERLLLLAGLWDLWRNRNGQALLSYTIITSSPWDSIGHLHNRMPVILNPENLDAWIKTASTPVKQVLALLSTRPRPLQFHPVSTLVNAPRNNRPECIQPVTDVN